MATPNFAPQPDQTLTELERRGLERGAEFDKNGRAYAIMQSTTPYVSVTTSNEHFSRWARALICLTFRLSAPSCPPRPLPC